MLEALFSETEKVSIVLTLTEFNGGLAQKIEEYCACHVRNALVQLFPWLKIVSLIFEDVDHISAS